MAGHDQMVNTIVRESATRNARLWSLLLNVLSNVVSNASPGYWALDLSELADSHMATVTSRYAGPGGTIYEIEHTVTISTSWREAKRTDG